MDQPRRLADLILELCGHLHREGNVPVLLWTPSAGGLGPVSAYRVRNDLQTGDGPVIMITDGKEG
jgi:hypothetical protein